MKRQALVLGFLSVGGQVLLLRELVSSFNGDELFLGTALFGWLLSVAIGAFIGGRFDRWPGSKFLFVLSSLLLPCLVVAVRLAPNFLTENVGEFVPFLDAASASAVAMLPVGLLSGWLFPVITRRSKSTAAGAIVVVYLFEGIGAFVGGLAIALGTGEILSTLSAATAVSVIVLATLWIRFPIPRLISTVVIAGILLGAAVMFIPKLDRQLDAVKYPTYEIAATFDTHYGHQTVLTRNNSLVLMTDNTIEVVWPDPERAENHIIVPLLYRPEAERILYIGRADFLTGSLAENLPPIAIDMLDPRAGKLDAIADSLFPAPNAGVRIVDDPTAYLATESVVPAYDIIIVSPGEPDSYKNSRLVTPRFLAGAKSWLRQGGILCLPAGYDTDRYLGREAKQVLSAISRTLAEVFPHVLAWPGASTLFLASDVPFPDPDAARVVSLLNDGGFTATYISEHYLSDRLSPMKVERLRQSLQGASKANTLGRPILSHLQALYRSAAYDRDRAVVGFLLEASRWLIVIPAIIGMFFVLCAFGRRRKRTYSLFLFFTAGMASLTLELLSFYVYQSMAGSLYSEMAALIGAFMLGLAAGTFLAHRTRGIAMEYPALLLLLTAVIIFSLLYRRIGPETLLFFHACFLLVTAIGTASLFVGATNRYYLARQKAHRGIGYGWELVGSAMGALFTMTIILPVIGVGWLLFSTAILITLAFAGAVAVRR